MKNLLTLAMLLIAMTLTFTSCKKDDDKQNNNNNPTPTPTANKTQLLTAGPWKLTGASIGYGGTLKDIFPYLQYECETDDLISFYADFTGYSDDAQNECYPGGDDFDFTWSWNSNQTSLIYDDEEFILVDLTSTTLKIKFEEVDLDGSVYTELLTYTKQ